MTTRRFAWIVLLFAALTSFAAAQPATLSPGPDIEIGISTSEIAVKSNFSGAEITVFGAITHANPADLAAGRYDVVVSLEGPKLATTVRRKARVFGIWVNRYSVSLLPIPTSYSLSSTRTLDRITDETTLRRLQLGVDNLRMLPSSASGDNIDLNLFRDALLRLKEQSNLYRSDVNGVKFGNSTLFQASIRLPASIPVGTHTVHGYLFRDGKFVAQKQLSLHVVKTGLEQMINSFAYNDAFLYGLFAVFIAGATGWAGSYLFSKQ